MLVSTDIFALVVVCKLRGTDSRSGVADNGVVNRNDGRRMKRDIYVAAGRGGVYVEQASRARLPVAQERASAAGT